MGLWKIGGDEDAEGRGWGFVKEGLRVRWSEVCNGRLVGSEWGSECREEWVYIDYSRQRVEDGMGWWVGCV